jgi:hypothetical protein
MGHIYTVISPYLLHLGPKPIRGSWESNPARVKASKREYYLFYTIYLEYLVLYKNDCSPIQWNSGYTRLRRRNSPRFESALCRSLSGFRLWCR